MRELIVVEIDALAKAKIKIDYASQDRWGYPDGDTNSEPVIVGEDTFVTAKIGRHHCQSLNDENLTVEYDESLRRTLDDKGIVYDII